MRTSVPVLRLMAEIVREPTFPAGRVRNAQGGSVWRASSSNAPIRSPWLRSPSRERCVPAPAGHPSYTATVAERVAAVEAVTLEEAQAFHADFYGPQLGTLALVGDFDPTEMRVVIEEAFGDWESPYASTRVATQFYDPTAEVIEIETPDKANGVFSGPAKSAT